MHFFRKKKRITKPKLLVENDLSSSPSTVVVANEEQENSGEGSAIEKKMQNSISTSNITRIDSPEEILSLQPPLATTHSSAEMF